MNKIQRILYSLTAAAWTASFLCAPAVLADAVPSGTVSDSLQKYGMLPIYGMDVRDGTYPISCISDSPLLQAAQVELTVKNHTMTASLSIDTGDFPSLCLGTAQEAAANEEQTIFCEETTDGTYLFTFPVASLDREIPCAVFSLLDEQWYDNRILLDASSLPEDALDIALPDYEAIEAAMADYQGTDTSASASNAAIPSTDAVSDAMTIDMEDGEYSIQVECLGGSGKAGVSSPTLLVVKDAKAYVQLQWSSANYDYMIVGGTKYLNENTDGGNSLFTVPITAMDTPLDYIADTTAMGTPHEIVYTFTFYSESIGSKSDLPQEAAKKVVVIAFIIIVGGGILNHYVKTKQR